MTYHEQNQVDHSRLYDLPIEMLDLSETAINLVKRIGITSVGDCVDYFLRIPDAMVEIRREILEVLHTEVERKLIEHGYLTVDDAKT